MTSIESNLEELKKENERLREVINKIFKDSKEVKQNIDKIVEISAKLLIELNKVNEELQKYKILCTILSKKYNFDLEEIIN